jgi:hypothetical protein
MRLLGHTQLPFPNRHNMDTIDDLVAAYIKVRDSKSQYQASVDAKLAKYDEAMIKIESILMQQLQAAGVDSAKTPHGTAYKATKTYVSVGDWDAFIEHVIANEAWWMLERRVNKSGALQWQETHDAMPPGVNVRQELTINVRR